MGDVDSRAAAETGAASPGGAVPAEFTDAERLFVEQAARYLESPSFLIRTADLVGRPLESLYGKLPEVARDTVSVAVRASLEKGLSWVADRSAVEEGEVRIVPDLDRSRRSASKQGRQHAWLTAATGAAGGLFGSATLAVELPVSTLVMLRSIARVAEEMGADLADPAVRLDCLSVFSLGGPSRSDDAVDSAYFAARVGLNRAIHDAARYLTHHGYQQIAPAVSQLLARIAGRFQVTVGQKVAAQAVPILGALGGATVNSAFTTHFNTVALYHFGLRRLEREHGETAVEELYRTSLPGVAPASSGES